MNITAERLEELRRYAGSPREIMTAEERELCDLGQVYQGWTNRETWALNLWLSNEAGIYSTVRDLILGVEDRLAADLLQEWVEESRNYDGDAMKSMFEDVGSLWRVNWEEVCAAFQES